MELKREKMQRDCCIIEREYLQFLFFFDFIPHFNEFSRKLLEKLKNFYFLIWR